MKSCWYKYLPKNEAIFFLDELLGLPVIPTSSHLYLVNSSLELIDIILKLYMCTALTHQSGDQ